MVQGDVRGKDLSLASCTGLFLFLKKPAPSLIPRVQLRRPVGFSNYGLLSYLFAQNSVALTVSFKNRNEKVSP